ncbi:MAG: RHS repeat protein, partial [Verrucomicrobiae bacterium]|nr:RHS repeat protein [Verrucomicrobiae bacterium]
SVHLMLVSLNIQDIPLAYTPPRGPAIEFQLNYSQREMNQPATLNFANLGPRWNLNWISTLTFDTNNAILNEGTGGILTFPNFSSESSRSDPEPMTASYLERISPTEYHQRFGDSSVHVFDVTDGTRWFLSGMIDPQGRTVTLEYDGQYRLEAIVDAIGQATTFTYDFGADSNKITKITDPFGRTAQFEYDTLGRLVMITDAVGLTSQFSYKGDGDEIVSLITGYGTTTFNTTELLDEEDEILTRSLVATYPDGSQEKWEAFFSASTIPDKEPAGLVPQGMPTLNEYLEYRNTFYWDRKGMKEAPGIYEKAHIYHWNHDIGNLTLTGRLLESERPPLEYRIWYYYKGQTKPLAPEEGTLNLLTHIGRVLDDGSTQLHQIDYNDAGNIITKVDPVGRRTLYFYDESGIDLESVSQSVNGGVERLLTISYNEDHLPLTFAGQDAQAYLYTYNTDSKVETITHPDGEVTTFTYEDGYLKEITGPAAGDTESTSLTYDTEGRVRTITNALGYVVEFAYDNLDRLVSISYPDGTSHRVEYSLLDIS